VDFKVEKEWTSHGFQCVVVATRLGHRCGYVGIGRYHRLYGVGYSQESELLKERTGARQETTPEAFFDAHGGLTFADTREENPGLWFFGFDCAHPHDSPDPALMGELPADLREILGGRVGGTVWTEKMVAAECEKLAQQLNDVMDGPVWIDCEVEL